MLKIPASGVTLDTAQTITGTKTFSGQVTAASFNPGAASATIDNNSGYARVQNLNVTGATLFNSPVEMAGSSSFKVPTTDSTGTPGAATINKEAGKSSLAAGATTVVITNSVCLATTSIVHITPLAIDANIAKWSVAPAAGSFTVTVNAAAAANWPFAWSILNKAD